MLKNSCNKKVPGKFKDESASKCITEFVGLRSKMYSFMFDDKKDVSKAEVRVAKGVQKSVIFNDLRFSTYLIAFGMAKLKSIISKQYVA